MNSPCAWSTPSTACFSKCSPLRRAKITKIAAGARRGNLEGEGRRQVPGRPEDTDRNAGIAAMLRKGVSWNEIEDATRCSRATIAKIATRTRQERAAA